MTPQYPRCCCGDKMLVDGEPVISGGRLHESLGPTGNFCGTVVDHDLRDLRVALAASQERVRELEAENVALRANASASVVRRLVEQGALRTPSTAGAEGEQGLDRAGGVQD